MCCSGFLDTNLSANQKALAGGLTVVVYAVAASVLLSAVSATPAFPIIACACLLPPAAGVVYAIYRSLYPREPASTEGVPPPVPSSSPQTLLPPPATPPAPLFIPITTEAVPFSPPDDETFIADEVLPVLADDELELLRKGNIGKMGPLLNCLMFRVMWIYIAGERSEHSVGPPMLQPIWAQIIKAHNQLESLEPEKKNHLVKLINVGLSQVAYYDTMVDNTSVRKLPIWQTMQTACTTLILRKVPDELIRVARSRKDIKTRRVLNGEVITLTLD